MFCFVLRNVFVALRCVVLFFFLSACVHVVGKERKLRNAVMSAKKEVANKSCEQKEKREKAHEFVACQLPARKGHRAQEREEQKSN